MRLAAQLRIFTGVTAVIGSGGKTMLLRTLGEELAASGRVLAVHHYQNISIPPACPRPDSRQNWTNSGGATALCAPEAL